MNNILSRAGDLISTMQSMLCDLHENFGWDFWTTGMNHGTGYWDRDVGEPRDKLSHSCMEWPHNGLSLKIGENGEPEVFFIKAEHS